VYKFKRVPYGFKNSLSAFVRRIKLAFGENPTGNTGIGSIGITRGTNIAVTEKESPRAQGQINLTLTRPLSKGYNKQETNERIRQYTVPKSFSFLLWGTLKEKKCARYPYSFKHF
jgi:hypothetical protein